MARQLMARSRSPRLVNTSDSPPSGVLAEREPTRFAVDRLDDAAGEVEVAADERLDVSRLDAMLPVLAEVSAAQSNSWSAPVNPSNQVSVAGSAASFMYRSYISHSAPLQGAGGT